MRPASYTGLNTNRGRSPKIWGNCDFKELMVGHGGHAYWNDFHDVEPGVTAETHQGFLFTTEAGGTWNQIVGDTTIGNTGWARLLSDGGNDDAAQISLGGGLGSIMEISDAAGANKKAWWEARFRLTAITTINFFIGMHDSASDDTSADVLFADGGAAMTADALFGFRVLEDEAVPDPDGLDAVHNLAAEVVVKDAAQVLVANTIYKVGNYFDGEKMYWFVNGTQVGDGVLPAATNFPDATVMRWMMGYKAGGTAFNIDIDWLAIAQADNVS
jgi:hypothetical protein